MFNAKRDPPSFDYVQAQPITSSTIFIEQLTRSTCRRVTLVIERYSTSKSEDYYSSVLRTEPPNTPPHLNLFKVKITTCNGAKAQSSLNIWFQASLHLMNVIFRSEEFKTRQAICKNISVPSRDSRTQTIQAYVNLVLRSTWPTSHKHPKSTELYNRKTKPKSSRPSQIKKKLCKWFFELSLQTKKQQWQQLKSLRKQSRLWRTAQDPPSPPSTNGSSPRKM